MLESQRLPLSSDEIGSTRIKHGIIFDRAITAKACTSSHFYYAAKRAMYQKCATAHRCFTRESGTVAIQRKRARTHLVQQACTAYHTIKIQCI
ncbi:hypothetical protein D3C80_1550580 [compost metagenome]